MSKSAKSQAGSMAMIEGRDEAGVLPDPGSPPEVPTPSHLVPGNPGRPPVPGDTVWCGVSRIPRQGGGMAPRAAIVVEALEESATPKLCLFLLGRNATTIITPIAYSPVLALDRWTWPTVALVKPGGAA